jgi:hypothetical protein
MGPITRRLSSLGISIGLTVLVASCGSTSKPAVGTTAIAATAVTTAFTSTYPSTPVPKAQIVARVGATAITGATYDHWLAIVSAKIKISGVGAPAGKPFKLVPPDFTYCIDRLKTAAPFTVAEVRPVCAKEYAKAKQSALELLITGYWTRGAAAVAKISLTEAEVERRFQQVRKAAFPTPSAFRKFQEETLQTNQDLKFGIRSRMLTKLLFAKFVKQHGKGRPEAQNASAYEASLKSWKAKTICRAGYVIKTCRQYSK